MHSGTSVSIVAAAAMATSFDVARQRKSSRVLRSVVPAARDEPTSPAKACPAREQASPSSVIDTVAYNGIGTIACNDLKTDAAEQRACIA